MRNIIFSLLFGGLSYALLSESQLAWAGWLFGVLFLVSIWGLIFFFSIVAVEDERLVVYRWFYKTTFETVAISFGRK